MHRGVGQIAVALGLGAAVLWGAHDRVLADQAGPGVKKIVVSVTDAANKPVTGLTAADFVVKEGDATRDVTSVDAKGDPLYVEMMSDVAYYMTRVAREVRSGVSAFAKELLTVDPGAQVALVEVAQDAIQVENFTGQGDKLQKSIAMMVAKPDQQTAYLDGLADAAKNLQKKAGASARRAIVAFTIDETPDKSYEKNTIPIVRQSGAVVWGVAYRNAANNSDAREAVLDQIAKGSGGGRFVVGTPQNLPTPFTLVADILGNQYVLSYTRPAGPAPETIQVGIKRSGLKVYAPQWVPK
jgi:VWFA-related protein